MTAETLTLTSFLLARIADDERVAQVAVDAYADGRLAVTGPNGPRVRMVHHLHRHDPTRVLAECEAKRRIVEWHKSWPVLVETKPQFETADAGDIHAITYRMTQQIQWQTEQEYRERFGTEPPSAPILRLLALPYADHADYDETWRP